MELNQGTRKASNLSTGDDIISSMPDIVITHIMNLLSIQDAVRTSILARQWRFKWTLLTQLEFGVDFVEGNDSDIWYDERIISRLLIRLKGPITKFFLHVPDEKELLNVKYLHHWVLILSRKGIREFTIENFDQIPIKLPTHLYSCLELTHLKLFNCQFPPAPIFGSFPNLLSLGLSHVTLASGFYEIISRCPRLEILELGTDPSDGFILKLKLFEIAKLTNLKTLSFPLRAVDSTPITNSLIFHLGGYFPKLEELDLNFFDCSFVEEVVSRELVCDSFSRVKTLTLDFVDLENYQKFAFEIIWGCPNLQALTIRLNNMTMGQLQLLNVVFYNFRGSENELFFIKNLLACTPLLKKITIYPYRCHDFGGYKEKLMLAEKLSMFYRASAIAQVDFQCSKPWYICSSFYLFYILVALFRCIWLWL
ncbi:F-box/FBD/LRR-repeat protein At1g13570-like isoform X2 [Rutidosis leptorrhynchoides]|uniref:F-box/FBD/LRR-repeat protein At1g13570-like isoform X2 n=1 Tax=Rutidosis leptorrhynchoides TaxID=125765 RepID=UPI003A997D4B